MWQEPGHRRGVADAVLASPGAPVVGQCCSGQCEPEKGTRSVPAAPDCKVPALQGARWIGELPGRSFLKQRGPWISGVHAREGLV